MIQKLPKSEELTIKNSHFQLLTHPRVSKLIFPIFTKAADFHDPREYCYCFCHKSDFITHNGSRTSRIEKLI